MSSGENAFIRLNNIVKVFPGARALDGVSFDVRQGECHALCGENGAGKSTLIKVMAGAHKRDEGSYFIDEKEVHFKSPQEAISLGISCVYQELSIVPGLDVAKNLFIGNLPVKSGRVDYRKLYIESEEILKELDMPFSPRTLAGTLSVGQQQMIEIGRALTRSARIIIMDEPTSSLSEAETETLFRIIRKLMAKNIAIVYISHKLDEVMHLADRITVLRDGLNIVTTDARAITQEQLITHMIGRPLEKMYCKKSAPVGGEVLKVCHLTRRGVFEDISFSIHAGEVVGFFGLVGAGRSEIMRAVFGIDRYHEGTVTMSGKSLKAYSPKAAIGSGIGFCTEDRKKEGLALGLTVLVNMTLIKLRQLTRLGVINRRSQKEEAEHYVRAISIRTPSLQQLAHNLSGGNQQKVVLAKWLMQSPKLLIVDEPTRGIDVGSKAEIYGIINGLVQNGMAVIVVSSEIEEVMGMSDRVITICEGRKTAEFDVSDQLSREVVLTAALGSHNPDCAAEAPSAGGEIQ
ncbi:MAG: sugar ABC transporter ATP-binding protein [Clostridiales bacterium]|nr:sugar ABC transporter ATP-binding protein [Clostridiales bacterium]